MTTFFTPLPIADRTSHTHTFCLVASSVTIIWIQIATFWQGEIHAVFSQLRTNLGLTEGFGSKILASLKRVSGVDLNRGSFWQDVSNSVSPLFPLMHFYFNLFAEIIQHICQSVFKKMFVKIFKVTTFFFFFFVWKEKDNFFFFWNMKKRKDSCGRVIPVRADETNLP